MSSVRIDQEKIDRVTRQGMVNGILAIQLVLSREVRRKLSQPGTGRIYRIGTGKRKARNLREQGLHRASAPGQPPAVDTGRLRQSWAIGAIGKGAVINASQKFGRGKVQSEQSLASISFQSTPMSISFVYGSNLRYALALEYGSRRNLLPRPYVRPSIRGVEPQASKIMQLWVRRAFAEAGTK